MTGSGATCFGIYENKEEATIAEEFIEIRIQKKFG